VASSIVRPAARCWSGPMAVIRSRPRWTA